jgi:glycosyltransferase involved in cell wall biosynthesis
MNTLREAGHEGCLLARDGGGLGQQARDGGFTTLPASIFAVWQGSPRFDLVHAHDARAHTLAALASRVPFVVSRRVAFPISTSFASRWKYGRAARFLAVSKFVAGRLEATGIPANKIDIVYDAIDASSPASEWDPQGPVVALATSDPQKGRDLVERAAEIARIPIAFSTNLSKDLAHASLFLYISRSEGFGSAALLAMSRGVPVIASGIEGLLETFEDGVSGLAVENDPAAIAAAIERVRRSPELGQALVENAHQRVVERFSTQHLLAATLASYRRALGG